MVKFTAEDLAKIETKKLANIIRKLNEGKTLTAREDRILAEAKLSGGEVQTSAATSQNFASSWDELAKNLGVSRRALQDWRNPGIRPDLVGKWPQPRPDGRHDVTAWLQFMVDYGLKRADEELHPGDLPDDDQRSTRDWKNERERLSCVRLQRDIDRDDGKLLVANELEPDLGATFMAFQNRYSQLPERAAPRLVGFEDVHEIEDRLREDVDRDLRELNAAGYLDESLRAIIDSLPFDAETEKLLSLVCFAGQDREALLQLISLVSRQTLAAIGRRVIAETMSLAAPAEPPGPPVREDEPTPIAAPSESPLPPATARPHRASSSRSCARSKSARSPRRKKR